MPAFPYSHTLNDAHEQIVTNDAPYCDCFRMAVIRDFHYETAKRLSVPEARFVGDALGVS